MVNPFMRFYDVGRMVKKEHMRGELPTNGEAYRNLMQIALPSVAEMVLISLMGSIDTMMVGTLGSSAIAAVGLTGQPRMLMLSIFMALNVGVTAIVARRKGQGLREEANQTLRNSIVIIIAIAAVIMTLALSFARPVIKLAGAQPDTIDMSVQYFEVLAWFLPINALTMCINAAQRGTGNTRITLYVNVTANLVNVCFNYLLINGKFGFPKLGVLGAAIATGIGFCVGFALCLYSLFTGRRGDGFLTISLRDNWRLKKDTVRAIVKVGGNAMVEQVALRVGFFAYAAIVASLGTNAFAAHQICMQFLNLSFTFADGLGVASTSLVGQMMGRERPDLSVMYGKCGQRLALTAAIMIASLVILFRAPLVGLFVDAAVEPQVFETACRVMIAVALFQPFQMTAVVMSGSLRGAGDTRFVAGVMMLCVGVIRPLCSALAIYALGADLMGAWLASLVDMTLRATLVYRRFSGGKWHNIKV